MHAKLQLQDLAEVLALSDALSALAAADDVRPLAALQSAVQQQCRAWLDALHSRSMARLNGEMCDRVFINS